MNPITYYEATQLRDALKGTELEGIAKRLVAEKLKAAGDEEWLAKIRMNYREWAKGMVTHGEDSDARD